jgi:hypothetical protein
MLSLSKHERVSRVVLRQAQDDKGERGVFCHAELVEA